MKMLRRWACVYLPLLSALAVGCEQGAMTPNNPNAPGSGPVTPGDPNDPGVGPGPEQIDPGKVTLRRLNRAEYNATVRDLIGLDARPADTFPPDDFGYGFNNNADVLTISPLLFDLYEQSATQLVDEAMAVSSGSVTVRVEAEEASQSLGGASGDFWNLWSNGEISQSVAIPELGRYRVRVRAAQDKAGADDALMEVRVGTQIVQTFEVTTARADARVYEAEFTADRVGNEVVVVAFLNDYLEEEPRADRNLHVDWFEIIGPLDTVTTSSTRDAIMICAPQGEDDRACAREVFAAFGRRAWRRPLTDAELDRFDGLMDEAKAAGAGYEEGLRQGLRAMLLSPHFLFRVELPATSLDEEQAKPLSDYELASRLSYFLWSSMPDETLLELAEQGALNDDATLRAQVERMLADPRADALLDHFATQWLYLDAVLEVAPDYALFPDYSEALSQALRDETRLFVTHWFKEDRPLGELLTADYSFINEAVARHYNISGVSGPEHQRVTLGPETNRRGLLTHASLLTARSYPNRTSPVLRGVWVLKQLMCDEPPPPPPTVEGLPDREGDEGLTLRERLEQHRDADSSCFGCHATMDPIGFGLEHYDPTGAWRALDNGQPVDALGELPDGRTFTGALEMADVLANDPKFSHCALEKTMSYALGRGIYAKLGQPDRVQMRQLAARLEGSGATTHELITQVVLSEAFRMRRERADQEVQP